jgi:DNA modification methylase
MYDDLKKITENGSITAEVKIHKADTRKMDFMDDESVDFAFTSPPYLNNYDYADRTRLELYFLGWASSWKEISEKIRKKLIVSCSHQAKEMGLDEGLVPIKEMDEKLKKKLISISENLKKIKHTRGGKKDYDIMTIGYFNDMFRSMEEIYRVLNDGAYFCMILGDSAPYGIYIPTDIYLSKIGKSIGFRESKIYELRKRGGKWQYLVDKGIRHNVKLRESMIIFQK